MVQQRNGADQATSQEAEPPVLSARPATDRALRLLCVGMPVALAAVVVFFALVDPTELPIFPQCPLHSATGLHCPTCGASRAFHAVTHGDWQLALGRNALVVLATPLAWGYLIALLVRARRTRQGPQFPTRLTLISAIVLVAFGIARNLPIPPLSQLAP